jgi:TldD protein
VTEDLRDLEPSMLGALRALEPRTPFVEALAQQRTGRIALVDRRRVNVRPDAHQRGVLLRAWAGDRWMESSTTRTDGRGLQATVDALERRLTAHGGRGAPPGESTRTVGTWTARPARPMRDLSIEEQVKRTRQLFDQALAVPGVKDARTLTSWGEEERLYCNSAGARCYAVDSTAGASLAAIAMENGRVAYEPVDSRGTGGLERLDLLTPERVEKTAKMAVTMLSVKSPPSGEMNVVLDPAVTGTFAHESFGHGTEADQFVRERSYLAAVRGQQLGPEELTMIDDGGLAGGYGSVVFDDEGRPAQRTTLIDRGRFVGVLHDRETAAALGDRPTGNARRSDVLSRLYVRMTNTFVAPGTHRYEELLQEAKNGVTLERWTSGVEDPLGGRMQIKVLRGHLIRNGETTDLVGSMALSGNVLEFLRQIRGIGTADQFTCDAGMCGKGHTDGLRVGSGGVWLLSRAIVGPA